MSEASGERNERKVLVLVGRADYTFFAIHLLHARLARAPTHSSFSCTLRLSHIVHPHAPLFTPTRPYSPLFTPTGGGGHGVL